MPRSPVVAFRPSLDEDLADITRADQATLLHATLRAKVADRESYWIKRLVAEFRANGLTEPLMRSAVAAIAEGQALLEDLSRTMRLGHDARSRAAQPRRDSRAGETG